MTVSEAIAEWLHEKEITHAFGIVGGGNHILFNAISQAKKTEVICCHHEQAAAMASCYHNRITGRVSSIALVTTGAGSTNAITGFMAAYMDSIPLLVISGNEASKYMGAKTRVWGVQGYDSRGVVAEICKANFRFPTPSKAPYHLMPAKAIGAMLEDLFYQSINGRQGPVWIDIPKDVQSAVVQ